MDAILVTGGAGYIGSHTCKALHRAGFLPVVYDNLSTGHAYAVKWGPFVHADLNDKKALLEAFDAFKPKAVLHFAADSILFESVQNPLKYYKNNVGSTLSLLEAMLASNVSHLVFSSTCATYGHPIFSPITEEHPQSPISPYGKSKWMVEKILNDFEKAYPFSHISLRYFNAAGADLATEIGENHLVETHLIPNILLTLLGAKEEVPIYGADFPTRDGSAIRDYIHVGDLAQAHVLALQWLLTHKKSLSVNLGTGSGHSVFEIIQAVEAFTQKSVPIRILDKRPGEPAILTAENKKAYELFGWKPELSLETIIASAWKWHTLLAEKSPLIQSTLGKR